MSEKIAAAPEIRLFRPPCRAFLVYYVAMAICFLGPLINPDMGLPLWLGVILGLILVLAVAYQMIQEYQITRTGVRKFLRRGGAVQEISWENLGVVQVRRGLTQTLMNVGNIVLDLVRYAPDGTVVRWIGMPVRNNTSVIFGGDKLDEIYVTSMARVKHPAVHDIFAKEVKPQFLAGSLFRVTGLGIRGIPETPFGWIKMEE